MQILVIAIGALIAGFVFGRMAADAEKMCQIDNDIIKSPELSRDELRRYLEAEKS